MLDKQFYGILYKTEHSIFLKRNKSVNYSVMSDSLQFHRQDRQAPLSMKFSRQEYWSGLPVPSSRDLSYPRIEPGSPALQTVSLRLSHKSNLENLSLAPQCPPVAILYLVFHLQ